jgi:hypothetical protein
MNRKLLFVVHALTFAVGMTACFGQAAATTLTFDALGSVGTGINFFGPSVSESGFTITGIKSNGVVDTHTSFFYVPQNNNPDRPFGQPTLGVTNSDTTAFMTADSADPFSVTSIDLGENSVSTLSGVATFVGTFADTTTVTQSFTLDGVFGLQTFALTGFDSIVSFKWTMPNPYFMVDNIVIDMNSSSETPLPAALSLFATSLGAMGLLGWRRKRKAAAHTA